MDARNVVIQVAGRSYPLKVDSAEEEKIRRAGKKLEEMITEYEKSFGIRDKQDALAMACIRLGVELENAESNVTKQIEIIREEIFDIESKIHR